MFLFRVSIVLSTLLLSMSASAEAIRIQYSISQLGVKEVVGAEELKSLNVGTPKKIRSIPYYIAHDAKDLDFEFEEWEYPNQASLPKIAKDFLTQQTLSNNASVSAKVENEFQGSEMRIIRQQGPTDNRIDLTILGDGYTESEKDKFFEDVEWTVKGLFETPTFGSYLPLFNVYAIFTPSRESGIGDGSPKNTAFRLYRSPRGSKRGIMPGDEWALSRALRMAPATDYPIIIANDDYYGGLGGRWAIYSRSRISGLKVLRHELGHNFGEVGEEYDNGYVYRGANSSRSSRVDWSQWLSNPNQADVHEAKLLSGDYIWQDLGRSSYSKRFSLPNDTHYLDFDISSVGWATPDDVHVKLNGEVQDLNGDFHRDRGFFHFQKANVNAQSSYTLDVKENIHDGDNVLGFALAYAMPASYDFTPNKVGAFATYDSRGSKGYRPTHKSCLMKDMDVEHFCVVDQENMWIQFLNRISLIDSVAKTDTEVKLTTQNIEGLDIKWYKRLGGDWIEEAALRGLKQWAITNFESFEDYKVVVEFTSDEVRKNHSAFKDEIEFSTP